MADIYADAIARLAAKKAMAAAVRDVLVPTGETLYFDRPRPLSEWSEGGQVQSGHEGSGLIFPFRVLDDPDEFLVIGEERYSDGRTFLIFGERSRWIEANTPWRFIDGVPQWVCPVCDGIGDEHHRVPVDGQMERCPRAPKGYRYR